MCPVSSTRRLTRWLGAVHSIIAIGGAVVDGGRVGVDGGAVSVGVTDGVDGEGMGGEEVGGAVDSFGVDTGVSDAVGTSWAGGNVTGVLGLQPSSNAGIRISVTRIPRFIHTPNLGPRFV
jgi:hypothetical protein